MFGYDSFRKIIFRDELKYVFKAQNIDEVSQERLIGELFENPYRLSKQYILKEDLCTVSLLDEKLRTVLKDLKLIGAVKSLFLIQEDLRIPEELKKLFLKNEKIGFWIGAGVSKLLKMPLWKELGDSAIKKLNNEGLINFFEYQKIMNDVIDPKQKITIFHNFIPKEDERSYKFYHELFSERENLGNHIENPYNILVKFGILNLTSNIDLEFYKALKKSREFSMKDPVIEEKVEERTRPKKTTYRDIIETKLDPDKIDSEKIYYLHGYLDNIEETVLTTRDYLKAYYEDTSRQEFLKKIFSEYTMIFIGYGLEEFPILEHILKEPYRKHYVLVGTYLNEMNLFRLKKKYFDSINIIPIPYFLDCSGYNRLLDVLQSWLYQINNTRSQRYYDIIKKIDEVLD